MLPYDIHYDYIEAEDYVLFNKARLEIEPGITVVRGLNRDVKLPNGLSRQERIEKASNGSGKSAFFQIVPNLLLDSLPVGAGRKWVDFRKTKTKTPTITVGWHKEGSEDRYIQKKTWSETGVASYTSYLNGENQNTNTQRNAKIWRQDRIPVTAEEYFTLHYIDALARLPLFYGKDADKFEYILNLFDLQVISKIRNALKDRMSGVKEALAEERFLEDQLAGLLVEKRRLKGSELRKQYKPLRAKKRELTDRLDQLQATITRLEADKVRSRSTQKLFKLVHGTKVPLRSTLKDRVKLLQTQLSKAQQQDKVRDRVAVKRAAIQTLKGKVEHLLEASKFPVEVKSQVDAPSVRTLIDKLQSRTSCIESRLSRLKGSLEFIDLENPQKPCEEAFIALGNRKDIDSHLQEAIDNGGFYRNALKNLHTVGDQCYVCLTDLSGDKKQRIVKMLEKELAKQEKAVRKLRKQSKLATLAQEYTEQKAAYDTATLQVTEIKRSIKKEKAKLQGIQGSFNSKAAEKFYNTLETLISYREELAQLLSQLTPDTTGLSSAKMGKKLQVTVRILDSWIPVKDRVTEREGVLEKQKQVNLAEYSKLRDEADSLEEDLAKAYSESQHYQRVKEEVTQIQDKLAQFSAQLQDREALDALMEATSKTGIRIPILQHIAEILSTNMNNRAYLLFPEKTRFKMVVTEGSLDILVKRSSGAVCSVRNLSGAQKRMFVLLFLIARLPLIPRSKRSNLLILDEPTANLDPISQELFIQFLPVLNTVIPSIIVITPTTEEYNASREYVIVKSKGTSMLKAVTRESVDDIRTDK